MRRNTKVMTRATHVETGRTSCATPQLARFVLGSNVVVPNRHLHFVQCVKLLELSILLERFSVEH